ncbi:C4-dicarboxylate ABC transporter permease [Rhodobacterales bacterium 52_120_T64]|nr:C4-dicarboxylate ABC transporter permease [Rhodobacterales bacterium 52_120_T64]
MTGLELSIIAFAVMLVAIFLRIPIGVSMAITGFMGTWIVLGSPNAVLAQLKSLTYDTFASYSLSIVPLFLLMGHFATKSGISGNLFRAAADWFGHYKGGMAIAAVGSCAGFGAVCGSSLATASTMGHVALPELRRHGFSDALSTGVLAAGGTLGILIPPSVILVIYAIIAEQNIVKMFMAAMIPGFLAALGYTFTVMIYVWVNPDSATRAPRIPLPDRFRNLVRIWPVAAIFITVIGGIYAGIFTPTEGAAVGAISTGVYGMMSGGLDRRGFLESILSTASSTAMIFFIVFGAQLFNSFLAFTQTPQGLAAWVGEQGFSPMMVMISMLVLYLIFGCIMDSLSMVLLTIPIFFPIIMSLDFGLPPEELAIWFGIIALIVVEVGLITPPVGMNLFIIHSIAPEIPITQTYRGVAPFVLSDIIRVGILLGFPSITLWLVRVMF